MIGKLVYASKDLNIGGDLHLSEPQTLVPMGWPLLVTDEQRASFIERDEERLQWVVSFTDPKTGKSSTLWLTPSEISAFPPIGSKATIGIGTDRHPAEVVAVTATGKTIILREMQVKITEGSERDGSAKYAYAPGIAGVDKEYKARFSQAYLGWFTLSTGYSVSLGIARRYYDPHF